MTAKADTHAIRSLLKLVDPPGRTLIVGSRLYEGSHDRRGWYESPVGIDIQAGPGVDLVHDIEEPLPDDLGSFQHIDCCSVLEHVARPWLAAASMTAALAPGGSLLLSVPFVWRVHGYPSDYWRITLEALPVLFPGIQWLRKGYAQYGQGVEKNAPGWRDEKGRPVMLRTEVVGVGFKR